MTGQRLETSRESFIIKGNVRSSMRKVLQFPGPTKEMCVKLLADIRAAAVLKRNRDDVQHTLNLARCNNTMKDDVASIFNKFLATIDKGKNHILLLDDAANALMSVTPVQTGLLPSTNSHSSQYPGRSSQLPQSSPSRTSMC